MCYDAPITNCCWWENVFSIKHGKNYKLRSSYIMLRDRGLVKQWCVSICRTRIRSLWTRSRRFTLLAVQLVDTYIYIIIKKNAFHISTRHFQNVRISFSRRIFNICVYTYIPNFFSFFFYIYTFLELSAFINIVTIIIYCAWKNPPKYIYIITSLRSGF